MSRPAWMERNYDIVIVGGGIIACTFARLLVDAGATVLMLEAGGQHSRRAGENLKNFYNYQIDVDQYGGLVRGLMHPASIPAAPGSAVTRSALNSNQLESENLTGAVVAYALGGMAVHWTCAIPRQHDGLERMPSMRGAKGDALYCRAEELLKRNDDVHHGSLRHAVIKDRLLKAGHKVLDTPLAAKRLNRRFVQYTGADTVLGENLAEPGRQNCLEIQTEMLVTRLSHDGRRVTGVRFRDLRSGEEETIEAAHFIVAAGWLHTAQILWASGIHTHPDSALGRYLTDHSFGACRVALRGSIVDDVAERAEEAGLLDRQDVLPIPRHDPPPHLYLPLDERHAWQGLIFREAFQFDHLIYPSGPPVAPLDTRLVIDLKWFGTIDVQADNRMTFEKKIPDRLGMPQPTFSFNLSEDDRDRIADMMTHMESVARVLGDYVPGAKPFQPPLGASTHTMGATRMGDDDGRESVVDPNSCVWGFDNLVLGGNGLIATANAANPTLTSVALAIRAADRLCGTIRQGKRAEPVE